AAVIFNPQTAPGKGSFFMAPFEPVARALNVEPIAVRVSDATEIESAITAIGRTPGSSLIVMPDAFTTVHRQLIILLAARHARRPARHALPAIYPYRYEAADGGLLSYGVDTVDLLRRAAPYVDRILRGEKPAGSRATGPHNRICSLTNFRSSSGPPSANVTC